jgi:hypothetical protein
MSDKRMTVYVAGPFTSNTAEGVMLNVNRAIQAGIEVIKKGHHPYVPHLAYYMAAHPMSHMTQMDRRWIDVDSPWVLACDAIYIMPTAYELFLKTPNYKDTVSYQARLWGVDTAKIDETENTIIIWKSMGAMYEYRNAKKSNKQIFMTLSEIPQLEDFSSAH